MPKRLNNQHTAKKRREEKRKLLKRPGISCVRKKKSQVFTRSSASASAPATKQPSSQEKIYKLVLTKGPEDEDKRALWIASISSVFGKAEVEARRIILIAEYYDEKPILSSGNMDEIAGLKNRLPWSLRDATKIKE